MDIDIIKQYTKLSFSEQIVFPDYINKIKSAGAERYLIDFVSKIKIIYGLKNEVLIDNINLVELQIPNTLDIVALKIVILNAQQGKIKYLKFLEEIIKAGCCHYEVYLTSGKVIYFGRDGAMHVEYFVVNK